MICAEVQLDQLAATFTITALSTGGRGKATLTISDGVGAAPQANIFKDE